MRIEEVRVYSKSVPVVEGTYKMSTSDVKELDSTIVEISDEDVDATLSQLEAAKGVLEWQLAEIFLPIDSPDQEQEADRNANRLVEQLRAGAGFAAVAMIVMVGILSLLGAGGSVIIPWNGPGITWQIAPTIVAVVVLAWPRSGRRGPGRIAMTPPKGPQQQ